MKKTNKNGKKKTFASLPSLYFRAPRRRLKPLTFGIAPDDGLRVSGVEVCQTIQNLQNSVTLIADKQTVVRVYLDHTSLPSMAKVTGELVWRQESVGPLNYLPAMNQLRLDPNSPKALLDQRHNIKSSLNFLLPPAALRQGQVELKLNRIMRLGGEDLKLSGETIIKPRFIQGSPLRAKVIGFRYTDPDTNTKHTPDAIHFAFFKSYLKRAYPVAEVIWEQIVVNADFSPPFIKNTPLLANAQIAALRSVEVNSGIDPRTHYYGLVDDANGKHFMRGRASGIPDIASPDIVASGPCGTPNGFAGDNDLSYSDWYGAHELGHTFGRYHPGFPPSQQDASDQDFPYVNGQISHDDDEYVGFDIGDSTLGLPMRALPGRIHHDVMTYKERQWLSAHTYEAIYQRLVEEDNLLASHVE